MWKCSVLVLSTLRNSCFNASSPVIFCRDRQDFANDVEAQRAQRWRGRGPASGRSRGPSEFGTMEGARKRSRKDFLGYYRLMGIQEGDDSRVCLAVCVHAQKYYLQVA